MSEVILDDIIANNMAIIFDWGGVLIDSPTSKMVPYCARVLKVNRELCEAAYRKFDDEFQRGKISEDFLWKSVCDLLGLQRPDIPSLWGEAFRYAYSPKKEMFSLASDLRNRGHKIALLSNTEVPAVKYFHEQGYDMFDVVVFSCTEGLRKPERRIYEIVLERLGVSPNKAIFIDDKVEYVEGAKKVGINAILFHSPEQVKKEISDLLSKV